MNRRIEELATMAKLHVRTWSPGDGVTRYRFFTEPHTYFEADGLYTALGRGEAEVFLRGFLRGLWASQLKEWRPVHEEPA